MKMSRSSIALGLLLAAVALFVVDSSQSLPAVLASHFAAGGQANGYMSRSTYVVVALLLGVGIPLFTALLPLAMARTGGAGVNIPNRAYWFAAERREATIADIQMRSQCFACLLALFLAYLHWLLVQANARHPAVLSLPAFFAGLGTFLFALALWARSLNARFGLTSR